MQNFNGKARKLCTFWIEIFGKRFSVIGERMMDENGNSLLSNCAKIRRNSMNSQVFPFLDMRFPSPGAYTGTTVTVYSVSDSRFFRTVLVVLPGT